MSYYVPIPEEFRSIVNALDSAPIKSMGEPDFVSYRPNRSKQTTYSTAGTKWKTRQDVNHGKWRADK